MHLALILDLGQLKCEGVDLDSRDNSLAALLSIYASRAPVDHFSQRLLIRPTFNNCLRVYTGQFVSMVRAWESVGPYFTQTSFHRAVVLLCRNCRSAPTVRLYKRVAIIEDSGTPAGGHAPNISVDAALQRCFGKTKADKPCETCYEAYGLCPMLDEIRIVVDRTPWHLTLGRSFSPAIVDHDARIQLIVYKNPVYNPRGNNVLYSFKAAVAFDSRTDHFTLYWKQKEEFYHYDGMRHGGVAQKVDALPSPLNFAILVLQRES
ncbi:Cation channel sperm-associated protein subunit delta [Lasiodiplodia theobromae]|uniref:Cation channel sperm-associated protein subunit delta n=1 Tax=Lasiodiplodia theobromae TaxID=45133 RepID=UPI0015C3865D|nr:Cation channel sperm-associated protein subunit delta [Lasiodiplodia theobromae]KAF4536882.1 Cation channel sperm-associated protein subunit delta [Lasiodiplodia theobromae]